MSTNFNFLPDWSSSPGETIIDLLEERQISKKQFTEELGISNELSSGILSGEQQLTIALARQLEEYLGGSVEFWMSREFQYREDLSRNNPKWEEWVGIFPTTDMINFQWLKPSQSKKDIYNSLLTYFGVNDISAWNKKYSSVLSTAVFKESTTFESQSGSVSVWLRKGELISQTIECEDWDREKFISKLKEIRKLTRIKRPDIFIPRLVDLSASCGVAVAVVRAPKGCRASGVTTFLSENKAMIILSFRYLSDDHFWFAFFHEAGHLILHDTDQLYIETEDLDRDQDEEDANKFAENVLIPPEHQSEFFKLNANHRDVIRFARKIGISPGIVTGQMQHHGLIGYDTLNKLKRRYAWE